MELETSGWRDLDERLAKSKHSEEEIRLLAEHLSNRLVAHFGVDTVECWLGKDGTRHHSMREVAAAAIAHLAPVIDAAPDATISSLGEAEVIGGHMPPPWDDHWRSQPRTASWRS